MSKKRKLESLQQLGVLKPEDVRQIQAKLNPAYRIETPAMRLHNLRWANLSVVAALGWGSIATTIAVAWKLSH